MSDNEQADNDDMPVTVRLWSVVEELQNIRQQNEIDRREGQNLQTAIAEVDAVRKSVQAERSDTDAGE